MSARRRLPHRLRPLPLDRWTPATGSDAALRLPPLPPALERFQGTGWYDWTDLHGWDDLGVDKLVWTETVHGYRVAVTLLGCAPPGPTVALLDPDGRPRAWLRVPPHGPNGKTRRDGRYLDRYVRANQVAIASAKLAVLQLRELVVAEAPTCGDEAWLRAQLPGADRRPSYLPVDRLTTILPGRGRARRV